MRYSGRIAAVLTVAALTGCGVPHNDVMLFGTDTKVALDVSAPPENAGSPQITLGYKRREFVLMPLLVNARDSEVADKVTDQTLADAKYTGRDGNNDDTYSVLASFGADFEAGAEVQSATAGGGLAQYFATGMAARILADRGGANLVRTNTVEEVSPAIRKRAAEIIAAIQSDTDQVVAFADDNGVVKDCRVDQILAGTSVEKIPSEKARIESMKSKPSEDLRRLLDVRYRANVRELALNVAGKTGC